MRRHRNNNNRNIPVKPRSAKSELKADRKWQAILEDLNSNWNEESFLEKIIEQRYCIALTDIKNGQIKPVDKDHWPLVCAAVEKRKRFLKNAETPRFAPCGIYKDFFLVRCYNKYARSFLCHCLLKVRYAVDGKQLSFTPSSQIPKILEKQQIIDKHSKEIDQQPTTSVQITKNTKAPTSQQYQGFQLSVNYFDSDSNDSSDNNAFNGIPKDHEEFLQSPLQMNELPRCSTNPNEINPFRVEHYKRCQRVLLQLDGLKKLTKPQKLQMKKSQRYILKYERRHGIFEGTTFQRLKKLTAAQEQTPLSNDLNSNARHFDWESKQNIAATKKVSNCFKDYNDCYEGTRRNLSTNCFPSELPSTSRNHFNPKMSRMTDFVPFENSYSKIENNCESNNQRPTFTYSGESKMKQLNEYSNSLKNCGHSNRELFDERRNLIADRYGFSQEHQNYSHINRQRPERFGETRDNFTTRNRPTSMSYDPTRFHN